MRLLAQNHSVILRTYRSILPIPQFSATGRSIRSMKNSQKNCLNGSDQNGEPGSILSQFSAAKRYLKLHKTGKR